MIVDDEMHTEMLLGVGATDIAAGKMFLHFFVICIKLHVV